MKARSVAKLFILMVLLVVGAFLTGEWYWADDRESLGFDSAGIPSTPTGAREIVSGSGSGRRVPDEDLTASDSESCRLRVVGVDDEELVYQVFREVGGRPLRQEPSSLCRGWKVTVKSRGYADKSVYLDDASSVIEVRMTSLQLSIVDATSGELIPSGIWLTLDQLEQREPFRWSDGRVSIVSLMGKIARFGSRGYKNAQLSFRSEVESLPVTLKMGRRIEATLVVLDADKRPLPGVRVTFMDGSTDKSDSEGCLDVFSQSGYTESMKLSKEGYVSYTTSVLVSDGRATVSMDRGCSVGMTIPVETEWVNFKCRIRIARGLVGTWNERVSKAGRTVIQSVPPHRLVELQLKPSIGREWIGCPTGYFMTPGPGERIELGLLKALPATKLLFPEGCTAFVLSGFTLGIHSPEVRSAQTRAWGMGTKALGAKRALYLGQGRFKIRLLGPSLFGLQREFLLNGQGEYTLRADKAGSLVRKTIYFRDATGAGLRGQSLRIRAALDGAELVMETDADGRIDFQCPDEQFYCVSRGNNGGVEMFTLKARQNHYSFTVTK